MKFAGLAILMTSVVVVGTGFSTDVDPGVSPMTKDEIHCVVEVVDQLADGELVTTDPVCFRSFAAAMEVASGGALTLPADARGGIVFSDTGVGALASNFTIGIHYDGYGGTGSSITVVGDSCTGGYWNTPASFDNRISSSYNGCARLKHWNYPGASGYLTATTGVGTTDNLNGTANNKTESVSYHSS